jgi:hypothetical protein
MSRIVYPPAPLIARIMTAAMGLSRNLRAFSVPDMEKANSGIFQNLAISRNLWYSFGMVGSQSRFGRQTENGRSRFDSRNLARERRSVEKEARIFLFESTVTH